MNTCRWCGGRSQSVAFCSAECASAANEMPELIHRSSDPLPIPSPRQVAAPKRSWFLGVLSGGLMGLGLAMALSPQAPTPRPACGPRNEMARAKVEVRAATLDFVQNGLAGVWDGRIDEPSDLSHWFVAGDATASHQARIFQDQIKRAGTHLTDAEVVDEPFVPLGQTLGIEREIGLAVAVLGLHDGRDADLRGGENGRNLRERAGAIDDRQAQIITADDLVHRRDGTGA